MEQSETPEHPNDDPLGVGLIEDRPDSSHNNPDLEYREGLPTISSKLAPNLGVNLLAMLLPLMDKDAHNFEFEVPTPLELFDGIDEKYYDKSNDGKRILEEFDNVKVTFMVYRRKTIINIKNSSSPHKLEEYDTTLAAFLNERRKFLIKEGINGVDDGVIPAVGQWIVLQCDVNIELPYNGYFKFMGKIEFKELGLLVKVYKKRIDYKKFIRFEVTVYPHRTFREFILDVLYPNEFIRRQNEQLRVDKSMVEKEKHELESRLEYSDFNEDERKYQLHEEQKLRSRVQTLEQQVSEIREQKSEIEQQVSEMGKRQFEMSSELEAYKRNGIFIPLTPSEIREWNLLAELHFNKYLLKVTNAIDLVKFHIGGLLLKHRPELDSR